MPVLFCSVPTFAAEVRNVGVGVDKSISVAGSSQVNAYKKPYNKPHSLSKSTRISALPVQPDYSDLERAQIALGERLFHDPLLSKGQRFSCASCHNLNHGGDDGLSLSLNALGGTRLINTPSIFNVKYNFRLNWNGNFTDLNEHLVEVLQDDRVMGRDLDVLLKDLAENQAYASDFNKIYSDGLSLSNLFAALDIFQRSLVTPDSAFDRYINGEREAMSDAAIRGYHRFEDYGCSSCHQGRNIGGNMFQQFGVFGDYALDRYGQHRTQDFGRYQVTGNEQDRFYFRVPSLRNVALTAPYFHDGSVQTLAKAVALMARYQLGRTLSQPEIADIVAFLKSLTGVYQPAHINNEEP